MITVVGTGPAGITAAYLLAKAGEKVQLIDAAEKPGGLWRGFDYDVKDKTDPMGRRPVHFETGMHWYTDCGIPEIDTWWRDLLPNAQTEIPREIAGCYWTGQLQTNSPYPDLRNGGTFENRPILEKIWGVPLDTLAPSCERIVKIDRVVGYGEENTREAYDRDPRLRSKFAWPDQRRLPTEYQSGRSSMYPHGGLGVLVLAALTELSNMGVEIKLGRPPADTARDSAMFWAAGVRGAAKWTSIPWPGDMTPPRELTVINALSATPPAHDLHYAFSYESGSQLFRVTWYRNFTQYPADRRVTYEFLGDVPTGLITGAVGVHNLGPVLPVPTITNEARLEELRYQIGRTPNFKMIGSGATKGLFFQPEVLRHVWDACQ